MSDQTKPSKQDAAAPTGEWTEGMVFAYWESEDWQGLADAHKAQIAAAYQKGYEDGRTDKNTIE